MYKLILNFFFLIIFIFTNSKAIASSSEMNLGTIESIETYARTNDTLSEIKNPKLTAAILTITLGMLGAHRLFLGCKPWIPIFYVITVGGVFFILPLIDLIAILTTKDVSKFYNNNNLLMWLEK